MKVLQFNMYPLISTMFTLQNLIELDPVKQFMTIVEKGI